MRKRLTELKTILLVVTISLSLTGCLREWREVPELNPIWQCAYSAKYKKFRCVNTKTKQTMNIHRDEPHMEGAQCLSIEDFEVLASWLDEVKDIAKRKCK